MNILHINDKIEIRGGVEVYISQLIDLIPISSHHQLWLGISKYSSDYNIETYRDEERNQYSLSFSELTSSLTEIVNSNKIDIIHIHSISDPKLIDACFDLAPVVRSMHEPRIVCPGHGKFLRYSEKVCDKDFGMHCLVDIYREGCSNRHPKRVISAMANTYFEINTASKKYSSIIVMSKYMEKEAIQVGFSKDIISYNPYFTPIVEETAISNTPKDKEKTLLFIGRLSKTKGTHYFIESGLELLKKGHNINFAIVGDGYDRHYFENMIPKNYKSKFTFHGWKDGYEIQEIFNNSYLLVFPSIYPEAFGIVGIEALMRGLPVVGFDVGGVSTWLKNNINGFLVPVKNIEKLTQSVGLLLEDEVLYREMSLKAREVAIDEFTPDKHIIKLIELYEITLMNKIYKSS